MRLEDLNGRKVMVALSGGLDSSHALWRVLVASDADVFAHRVHFALSAHDLHQRRLDAEAQAAGICARWLHANIRSFHLSSSRVEFGATFNVRALSAVMPLVALAATGAGFGPDDVILTGHNAGDEDRLAAARAAGDVTARDLIDGAVASTFASVGPAPVATWLEPVPTRAQQVSELPAPLAAAAWSCRMPLRNAGGWAPCGLCSTCLELADLLPRYRRFGGDKHTTMALRLAMADPESPLRAAVGAAYLSGDLDALATMGMVRGE